MEQTKQKIGRASVHPAGPSKNGPHEIEGPGRLMPRSFFERHPGHIALRLLGKLLVRWTSAGPIAGRIVEAEAYLGPHNSPPDPAAHAHRGPTPRNQVLFGPAGHAYVYSIYGRYYCMNVSCEPEGKAGCVLLRALEPAGEFSTKLMAKNRGLSPEVDVRQLASGPSRLCLALGITRPQHNGVDLLDPASSLQLRDDGFVVKEASVTARIGINHAKDWPLRFVLPGHPCASGPRKLTKGSVGRCVFVD